MIELPFHLVFKQAKLAKLVIFSRATKSSASDAKEKQQAREKNCSESCVLYVEALCPLRAKWSQLCPKLPDDKNNKEENIEEESSAKKHGTLLETLTECWGPH